LKTIPVSGLTEKHSDERQRKMKAPTSGPLKSKGKGKKANKTATDIIER